MLGPGQWVEHYHLIMLAFQVLSNIYIYIRSFSLSLSLALFHLPLNALHSLVVSVARQYRLSE